MAPANQDQAETARKVGDHAAERRKRRGIGDPVAVIDDQDLGLMGGGIPVQQIHPGVALELLRAVDGELLDGVIEAQSGRHAGPELS